MVIVVDVSTLHLDQTTRSASRRTGLLIYRAINNFTRTEYLERWVTCSAGYIENNGLQLHIKPVVENSIAL